MKRILLLFVLAAFAAIDISAQHELRITTSDATATISLDQIESIEITDELWGAWTTYEGHEAGVYTFDLYVRGAYEMSVTYREHLLDETKAQFKFHFTEIGAKEDMIVDYNKETHACEVGIHYFLDNTSYGPVYVSDLPHNPFDINGDKERETYEDYPCTFDPETGLFNFNLVYFVYTDLGSSASGSFGYGKETMQLNGYVQHDYSFSIEYLGSTVGSDSLSYAIFKTEKGDDISKYHLAIAEGNKDSNEIVDQLINDTANYYVFKYGGELAIPMNLRGDCKAVVVTFNENGEAYNSYEVPFEFYTEGENPWVSLGMATYTDDILSLYLEEPTNHSYPVEVRENKYQPGLYRIINPYAFFGADTLKVHYIEIDATDPEGVWINGLYEIGLDIGAGPISVTSYAWYLLSQTPDATIADVKEAGWCGTLADGVITFPVDGIIYDMGTLYVANRNGAFKLDMNNMTPVDTTAKAPAMRLPKIEKFAIKGEKVKKSRIIKSKKPAQPMLKIKSTENADHRMIE